MTESDVSLKSNCPAMSAGILDDIASGVLVITPPEVVLLCNRRCRDIWHIPEALFQARSGNLVFKFIGEQVVESEVFLRRAGSIVAFTEGPSLELLHLRDGRVVEEYSEAHTFGEGKPGRVWTFHELSPALEREHLQWQGGAPRSVSRLAKGIAYDFSHLFGFIQNEASGLLCGRRVSGRELEAAVRIARAAQRAVDLAARLRGYARKQTGWGEDVDLNDLVFRVIQKLQPILPSAIELLFEPCTERAIVLCDTGMIEQVLTNLIWNASEAILPDDGQVRMSTQLVSLDASHVKIHSEAREGTFATVDISDTGSGMDPLTLERIFRPFFTTKKAQRREGLGLARANAIVGLHRGWIQVSSQLGYGSVFRVFLPTANETEIPPTQSASCTRSAALAGPADPPRFNQTPVRSLLE